MTTKRLLLGILSTAFIGATGTTHSGEVTQQTQHLFVPYQTANGYLGTAAARGGDCMPAIRCGEAEARAWVPTQRKITPFLGIKLGHVNFGDIRPEAGPKNTQRVDLHFGNIPVAPMMNAYAKAGGLYKWIDTTLTSHVAQLPADPENNISWTYSAGVQYRVNPAWAVRADWDQYRLKHTDQRVNIGSYSGATVYTF